MLRISLWTTLGRLLRFGLVGGVATVTYFVLAVSFPPLGMAPPAAFVMASLVSTMVSYVGHHQFTFGMTGAHAFHFPRFVVVAASLSAAAFTAAWVSTEIYQIDYRLTAMVVAAAYPIVSFLLNSAWVFVAARGGGASIEVRPAEP